MKKRDMPKSVERQMQQRDKTAELPEAEPYDYANMPDDLPSVEYWYKVRERYLFQQEKMSNIQLVMHNNVKYEQNKRT